MVESMDAGSLIVVRAWVSRVDVRGNGGGEERASMVHDEPKRCMVFHTGVWFSLQVYDIAYVYDFTRETPTVTRPYRALAGPGIAGLLRRRRPRTAPAGGRDRGGRGMIRSRGGGGPWKRVPHSLHFPPTKNT